MARTNKPKKTYIVVKEDGTTEQPKNKQLKSKTKSKTKTKTKYQPKKTDIIVKEDGTTEQPKKTGQSKSFEW